MVEALLYYLYHGTYCDPGNSPTDLPSIVLDARMFAIADKYFVKSLKTLIVEKFINHCRDQWNTPSFAQAVAEVYETAPEDSSLKEVVVTAVQYHVDELLTNMHDYTDFHKALREVPGFGADVLVALAGAKSGVTSKLYFRNDNDKKRRFYGWRFNCPAAGCGATFSLNIPLGTTITFGCPSGHYAGNTFSWWAQHGTGTS